MSTVLQSLLIRAVRTFLQAFLAVLLASPALDLSQPALKAAGIAGLASLLTMAHRLLDETAVPSLPDHSAAGASATASATTVTPHTG
jgi:hypothetical protein